MDQKVLKIDDLDPDGLRVTVKWEAMDVESSIFVPCVNTDKAAVQLRKLAKRKKWEFNIQICVEGGRLGLRAWRTV